MATKKAVGKKMGATKRPKQVDLIPDRGIPALDNLANDYAEIRDQRIALNSREHDLKEALRTQMHNHDKTEYKHGDVSVKLVSGDEEVKVKIKAEKKVEIEEE